MSTFLSKWIPATDIGENELRVSPGENTGCRHAEYFDNLSRFTGKDYEMRAVLDGPHVCDRAASLAEAPRFVAEPGEGRPRCRRSSPLEQDGRPEASKLPAALRPALARQPELRRLPGFDEERSNADSNVSVELPGKPKKAGICRFGVIERALWKPWEIGIVQIAKQI